MFYRTHLGSEVFEDGCRRLRQKCTVCPTRVCPCCHLEKCPAASRVDVDQQTMILLALDAELEGLSVTAFVSVLE